MGDTPRAARPHARHAHESAEAALLQPDSSLSCGYWHQLASRFLITVPEIRPKLTSASTVKTAASIHISLNDISTPKRQPHLSKNRQPRVLARIQPQLIFIPCYSSRTLHRAGLGTPTTTGIPFGNGGII
eukprot:scaffold23157_cov57-Phaeocystis_antarctica.AAC.3